jgi:hypothetical protein
MPNIVITSRLSLDGSATDPVTAAVTRTSTTAQVGDHSGSVTQDVGHSADEALALPADVTGDKYIQIYNTEPTGGNSVLVDIVTGGGFAGIFEVKGGQTFGPVLLKSGNTLYVRAQTATVRTQNTAIQP